jgi:predicted lysophospholipase L1 biosynthesis ABC-type transport system permease subunit
MYANNNLARPLMWYQFTSMAMRFMFIVTAIPVFFVAWYVGTTVSDVSYNLRRREIGLLLTKGFSNSQIFGLFLTESILIGVFSGLVGVAIGFLLGPFFISTSAGLEGVSPVLSNEVIIITVIFGLAIALLSTFRPSRRAAKLPAVEALREYTYTEEVKPYKQRLPWIAFILGLYKIVMFLLGIGSLQMVFRQLPFTNIFLIILLGIWLIIDTALIYIGPLLFFWGFTKIFIRGSLKFQELVARAAKFLGDLGTLATKNVQRNPARAASIAFLVALIVGYSLQTIGGVASSQDYNVRRIKADVGADINVQLAPSVNITEVLGAMEDIAEKESTTVQYSLSGSFPGESQQITAIDPETWLSTAYYEEDWFSGRSAAEALQIMKTNSRTIILEINVASRLKKKVGDTITVNIGYSTLTLEVVGFFGRELPEEYAWRSFQSFITVKLCESLNMGSQPPKAAVLVKLKPGADSKVVASEIRKIKGVSSVSSIAEELEKLESNLLLVGPLRIQQLGVIFSILAASVAVGLATLVSLQERKKEASIMWTRGLSFKQLVIMLLTENMAVVTFAVILGTVVGLIAVHGNVAASNSALTYTLVTYRMVFPLDAIILLASCLILIFTSTITPTLLLTKRYISKVERIVRL